jgi:predicted exporter
VIGTKPTGALRRKLRLEAILPVPAVQTVIGLGVLILVVALFDGLKYLTIFSVVGCMSTGIPIVTYFTPPLSLTRDIMGDGSKDSWVFLPSMVGVMHT